MLQRNLHTHSQNNSRHCLQNTSLYRNINPNNNPRPGSPLSEKPLISERSSPQELDSNGNRFKSLEVRIAELELKVKRFELQLNNLGGAESFNKKYVPYFINESHIGLNNITTLNGHQLELVMEILNYQSSSEPLIYPFGNLIPETNYKIMTLELKYVGDDDDGIINGVFRRNESGIYVIELINFQTNYSFPLTLTCKASLKSL